MTQSLHSNLVDTDHSKLASIFVLSRELPTTAEVILEMSLIISPLQTIVKPSLKPSSFIMFKISNVMPNIAIYIKRHGQLTRKGLNYPYFVSFYSKGNSI